MALLDEQLDAYLRDVHAIEQQALPQLRAAPDLVGDPALATAFRQHLVETEHHEEFIRDRLEARGVAPARLKDAVFRAGGYAFVLFAASQPDTPGKLLSHALSYEHLELAGYELLRRVAERAGDETTMMVSIAIRENERAMAERLEASYDRAVEASLRYVDPAKIDDRLDRYLADAHAIEVQAIALLERGSELAGDAELAQLYEEHLEASREHQRSVAERLDARGGSPSKLKGAALRLGALNWAAFFAAQPDTPAKLAAFAYAFEFLEVGAYEQLKRVARRAGDHDTAWLAEAMIAGERVMADRLWRSFDAALEASVAEHGVHA